MKKNILSSLALFTLSACGGTESEPGLVASALTGPVDLEETAASKTDSSVSCTETNLGPGDTAANDHALGVRLLNKWGSTVYYSWVIVPTPLASSASFSWTFSTADGWRSPHDVNYYGGVSLNGYTVECLANAGVFFQSNATETYVTPVRISETSSSPKGPYANNTRTAR